MIPLVAVLLVGTFLPHSSFGQWNHFSPKFESMSYSIVNGKLYVDPPTTEAPGFLETWFPWWSGSYESSNPESVDDAILNSVTGPPTPEGTTGSSAVNSFGLPVSGVNPTQNQSPYLTNDEDNYIPSASYNIPYQMASTGPGQGNGEAGQYNTGYPNANQIPPYYMPPLPYPFSSMQEEATTEAPARPFYQPILDLFGYGSSAEEEEEELPLPLPFPSAGGMNGYSSSPYAQNGFQPQANMPLQYNSHQQQPQSQQPSQQLLAQPSFFTPSYAQARSSFEDDAVQYVADSADEGKYSVHSGPKSDLIEIEGKEDNGNPCPKVGVWQWNGEVCIASGSVPIWACKPSDLVMSGRAGVCRNKIFFPLEINLEQKT